MKLKFMSVLLMIGIILSFASCSGGSKEMMYKSIKDSYESEPQDGFWQMKYFNYSGYNDDTKMNYKMQYRSGNYLVTDFLDGVCINDYLGDEDNVELPKKIKDKPVLKIGFKYYYDKIYDAYRTEFPFKGVSIVTISSTVKYIEPSFFECEWIDVNPYNEYYSSKDGILYSKSFDSLLMIPGGYQEETIEVKNGTKYVADAYSDNLMRMVIPESVEGFGCQSEDELRTNDNVVFDVSEKNKTYKSVDGVLYNKKRKICFITPETIPQRNMLLTKAPKRSVQTFTV